VPRGSDAGGAAAAGRYGTSMTNGSVDTCPRRWNCSHSM
jgi:hypothetical protein